MRFHYLRNTIIVYFLASFTVKYGRPLHHEKFRPCQKVSINDEIAMNISMSITKIVKWNKIIDGFPFLFKHPKSNMTAIVCMPEKVASTSFKTLFIKALEYSIFESEIRKGADPHEVKFAATNNILSLSSARELADAILNPNIPRIMFTRNPYSRALSGYSDKVAEYKDSYNFHPGLNESASFYEFTQYILDYSPLNAHFQQLTHRCMLRMGMRYDYYLKIETMPQWYEPFIDLLGLRDDARLDTQKPLAHEKNADAKLKQFYNESSANRISRFAKCDLQAFGYPEWNGTEADNFIRSIHKLPTTTNVEQKFGCYVNEC